MNEGLYDQTFGRTNMHLDRRTDRQTDGRTDLYIRPHARAHAHTRTVACLHAHTKYKNGS